MANYNSRAATPMNLVTGRLLNALSLPFTANCKDQSIAPKTLSKNLIVGLVKILRKRHKGPRETASNYRATNRQNREELNLGSMEQTNPYPGLAPTQIQWWIAPNRVDEDPSMIQWWNGQNRVSTGSAAWGTGFWESSGLRDPTTPCLLTSNRTA
jgi:hypothetical protein